jgi:hypothetical protein
MNLNNNKDNNKDNNNKVVNTIFNTSLFGTTKNSRYCITCHVRLEPSKTDKYIYSCPSCGVGPVNIFNTEPSEKLRTTFPSVDPERPTGASTTIKKFIHQPEKDRISRSKYFIRKNIMEKNKISDNEDPHLKILMQNSKIRITNFDYNIPPTNDDEYNE